MRPIALVLLINLMLPGVDASLAKAQPETPTQSEGGIFQLGTLVGYGNFCVKKAGIREFKDPEGQSFSQHYGKPIRDLGPKGVQIYREGVKKGVGMASAESGEKCRQNLERLIKMYEKIQLKGIFYQNALKKLTHAKQSGKTRVN